MTGVQSLYEALAAAERSGELCALVTVVAASGSVPRHVGAKMLVYADGRMLGSVGGGELEARALAAARSAIAGGAPERLTYTLADPRAGDPGVCGGEVELFVEPLQTPPAVLVIGCGHVGRAVAHLAGWLGFRVLVTDDRTELCTPETTPGADAYLPGPLEEQLQKVAITASTYVVAVTRSYPLDVRALPLLLATPAPYIGVIGSRRRWLTTLRDLHAQGVTDEQLARVHAPIGIEISAETPEEIAVSILAEIIVQRRGGKGPPAPPAAD
jgi:xanthine dehydrogenase accessory factor